MKNLKGSAINKIIKNIKKMWKFSTMFSKKIFKKKIHFFCPQKVEKNTLKSCPEKLKSTFFSLLPAQPKQPKQKNSCSKMWPIDQLYIDTQLRHKSKKSENLGRCGRQNMLWLYLITWDWEWIFGHAVKAISSLGVRSPFVV